MNQIQISLGADFDGMSRSMMKALAFMFTRHMVSHCAGYGPEGDLEIRVAHPERPCFDYEDMTSSVFTSSRILDAMVKRELVRIELREGGAYACLTEKSFDLATQVMSALEWAVTHGELAKAS